ncbi:MAG: hypothetical protein J0H82_26570 [Alphaproteobacteria bacterium]|jgi:hypothetical protein|nr:hypothetical protein [Alphaproteobacteria bacterium]
MPKPLKLTLAAIDDARCSEDGSIGIVTATTADGRSVEIDAAPEIGLQLARATREAFSRAWIRQIERGAREATDAGPSDAMAAQGVDVLRDARHPDQVGLWALGTPMPPVIIMPARELPALIESARQVLDQVADAPAAGDRVVTPANTIRPARLATAIGETAIMVIASDEDGRSQALMLDLDRIDEFVETIRSTQAEALRQRDPRPLN